MALVKGANGVVFDAHDQVASGLVGGGHAVWVDAEGNPVSGPVSAPAEAEAPAAGKGSKG
jgi:hypothetical protein